MQIFFTYIVYPLHNSINIPFFIVTFYNHPLYNIHFNRQMYFKTIILKQSTISIRISSTSKIQNFLTIPILREFISISKEQLMGQYGCTLAKLIHVSSEVYPKSFQRRIVGTFFSVPRPLCPIRYLPNVPL